MFTISFPTPSSHSILFVREAIFSYVFSHRKLLATDRMQKENLKSYVIQIMQDIKTEAALYFDEIVEQIHSLFLGVDIIERNEVTMQKNQHDMHLKNRRMQEEIQILENELSEKAKLLSETTSCLSSMVPKSNSAAALSRIALMRQELHCMQSDLNELAGELVRLQDRYGVLAEENKALRLQLQVCLLCPEPQMTVHEFIPEPWFLGRS
jgi:hypothetical protein